MIGINIDSMGRSEDSTVTARDHGPKRNRVVSRLSFLKDSSTSNEYRNGEADCKVVHL